MSNACTLILVGVPSPVSEILLLSKTAKFPFPTMDYWEAQNQKFAFKNHKFGFKILEEIIKIEKKICNLLV